MGSPNRQLLLTLLAGVLAAIAIVGAVALAGGVDAEDEEEGTANPLDGFSRPRTVHLAPDGRLLITDVGTGEDDGRVVAVDLAAGTQEVLMDGLPSTHVSGQRFGDVAGPSGAAMAEDGTVCVVIGDGPDGRGFNALRCTDGLRVNLKEYEQANNPGGGAKESNPFDVVHAGRGLGDWYVSDAAANVVLHVSRAGVVHVVGIFNEHVGLGGAEGVPTGLLYWDGRLTTALFGGAVITGGEGYSAPFVPRDARPIAVQPPVHRGRSPGVELSLHFLSYSDQAGSPNSGSIRFGNEVVVVAGLDRPTGFVRLEDGRYVVAEEERGRLVIVEERR